jgi:hypothetical protein
MKKQKIKTDLIRFRCKSELRERVLRLMLLHNCKSMTQLIEKAIENLENQKDNDSN